MALEGDGKPGSAAKAPTEGEVVTAGAVLLTGAEGAQYVLIIEIDILHI